MIIASYLSPVAGCRYYLTGSIRCDDCFTGNTFGPFGLIDSLPQGDAINVHNIDALRLSWSVTNLR